MTPEHIELHRKRFEELEVKDGNSIDRYDDCQWYWRSHQNNRWLGYLMHAENQIVELPKSALFYNAEIVYLDELIEKLESQGIKIKSSGSE